MKMTKFGPVMTRDEKKLDIIKGIKKYLAVGYYDAVYAREKLLMTEYEMTAEEVEKAIWEV